MTVSLVLATMAFGGLSMGGPKGEVGWAAFVGFVTLPFLVWLTKSSRAAKYVQAAPLLIVLLAVAYVVWAMA